MCWTAQFRHDSDVYLLCLLPLLGLLPGSVSDLSDNTTGISRTILHSTGSVKSFKLFKIVLTESGCAELFGQLSLELDCDMFHGESIMMDVRLFRVGLQIVRCVIIDNHFILYIQIRIFIALEKHAKHGNNFQDEDVETLQVLFEQTDLVDLAFVRPGTSGINDSFLCYSVSLSCCHASKPGFCLRWFKKFRFWGDRI